MGEGTARSKPTDTHTHTHTIKQESQRQHPRAVMRTTDSGCILHTQKPCNPILAQCDKHTAAAHQHMLPHTQARGRYTLLRSKVQRSLSYDETLILILFFMARTPRTHPQTHTITHTHRIRQTSLGCTYSRTRGGESFNPVSRSLSRCCVTATLAHSLARSLALSGG